MPPSALPGDDTVVPTSGRALDVACGRGTVAVWLALRGLAVDAIDAAPTGLARGRELAAAHGVEVSWIEADLDDGLPVAGPYDVIVCQRFRDPALYSALRDALAPGALLVISTRSEVGDSGGRFRAAPGELLAAFADLDVIDHREGSGEAVMVARLAPRPVDRRRRLPRRSA